MEEVAFRPLISVATDLSWCARGAKGRERNVVSSSLGLEEACEARNRHLKQKYDSIRSECVRFEEVLLDDAEIVIVAFGIMARIAKSAVKMARDRGIKVGLLRPITLFPFPFDRVTTQAETGCHFLVTEMNLGQMVDDARLAVQDDRRINFLGRPGGVVISPEEIIRSIETIAVSK
jgi:2-oxoglutarate ferredoxin oxidoreductase subunit alpha